MNRPDPPGDDISGDDISGAPPPPSSSPPPRPDPFQGEPSPLHPAAVPIWIMEVVLPLAVALFLTGAGILPAFGVLMAVTLVSLVRYRRFRWRLDPDALIVEKGLFRRRRRVIQRDRIQTVDLERGVRHRLCGVVEVRVEAIGGVGTQGRLSALSPDVADRLRRVLLEDPEQTQRGAKGEAVEEELLARVRPRALVLAGLTGGRVGVVAAVVGFLLQFLPEEQIAEALRPWIADGPEATPLIVGAMILGLVGAALMGGFVLSVTATVLIHWNFTLSRRDGSLWVRRGLITEHRDSVPLRRVQAVRVEENVVRRFLGLASLRAVVAGRAGDSGDGGSDLLLPVGTREEAFEIARRILGKRIEPLRPLEAMPSAAHDRRRVRAAAAGFGGFLLTLGVLAWGVEVEWSPSMLAATVVTGGLVGLSGLALAAASYRALGWSDRDDCLLVREGIANRRTSIVPVSRLQEVATRASPFQRRRGLATLHLRVARPPGRGFAPRGLDMGEEDAARLRDSLSSRIGRSGPWGGATGGRRPPEGANGGA